MSVVERSLATALRRVVGGQVLSTESQLASYAQDYGQIVQKIPGVVIRPQDAQDVARVVKYAFSHDVPVSARGSGHSLSGQSLNTGGIVIDMRALQRLEPLQQETLLFKAEAGVRWREVVASSVTYQHVPPVLTGYPHVTIGGTHSAGGWGSASPRYGAQVDHCLGLEVVTGTGEIVYCSRDEHPDLFGHALAGMGQFGIITTIWHELRAYRPLTRTYTLQYNTVGSLLADSQLLAATGLADYIECTIQLPNARMDRAEWRYTMRATLEVDDSAAIDNDGLVTRLSFDHDVHMHDLPTSMFVQQQDVAEVYPVSGVAHPWLVTCLPWSRAQAYIELCLERLPPMILGGESGLIRLWCIPTHVTHTPMLRVPDELFMVVLSIAPTIAVEQLPPVLAILGMMSDLSLKIGAKRYLTSWTHFDLARWQLHFGEQWSTIQGLKHKYDPKGILNPGMFE